MKNPVAFVLITSIIVFWSGVALATTPDARDTVAVEPMPAAPTGWVGLTVSGPVGATVTVFEAGASGPRAVSTATLTASQLELKRVVAWRCQQRVRRFLVEAETGDGTRAQATTTVRTPSCADRFAVTVRPRTAVRVGQSVSVAVNDRWRHGDTSARVCLRVRGASSCREASGGRRATVRVQATRPGVGSLVLKGDGFSLERRLEVRARDTPLRVLATGDSMIQIVDSWLARRLERGDRGTVTTDARISTGISKPMLLDWVKHARSSARRARPQATVMFVGANDGFPIGKAACCDAAWVSAYARRVRAMMAAYRRSGAGRVYWLTLPTPRDAERQRIYSAVNAAVKRAAAEFPRDEVSVIDLVPVFTPGGRYRSSIRGRTVRQADGIHLNVAGARIAADLIVKRLHADRLLR